MSTEKKKRSNRKVRHVQIHIEYLVCWLVTPCRLLVGSQSFGDKHCFHLQSRRGNESVCSSKARLLASQLTQTLKSEDYNLDHDHSDNLNFTQHTLSEDLNFPLSSETSAYTLLKPPTPDSDSHTPTSCVQR